MTGASDTGKSVFGSLVRRQLPRSRVFLPLSTSEFCWNDLNEEMHILAFANDWRFSKNLPVQACLNWLENLEFAYNRKHEAPGESKGPPGIFTSNDIENGWSAVDIKAFMARMRQTFDCKITFEMAHMTENEGGKRIEKCLKCGACALLWKSHPLSQKVQACYPAAYQEFARHINTFLYSQKPTNGLVSGPASGIVKPLSEFDLLVAEAESREYDESR